MEFFDISPSITALADKVLHELAPTFADIDAITAHNQERVLAAFIANRVSAAHFAATTGYGYDDRGRDVLDAVFAQCMGAEDALVRHSIVSGTHAITLALFGILRPDDVLLAATGTPYDTLLPVISGASGSLAEFGMYYDEVALLPDGTPDLASIAARVADNPKICMVHIQRSCGYANRSALSVETITRITETVHSVNPQAVVFVDNCYGEFVQRDEPTMYGADLMAGSLIKNPGGGIAENGGYICGRADLIEQCAARMTTPGVGREVGASLGHNRTLFMGLFHAPHVVGEALKTAAFTAGLFGELGYIADPTATAVRADIVQRLTLNDPAKLVAFCRGIQQGSPIDAFVSPEPWAMPGYEDPVVMAAGAFTMGSSIELSADAPLRAPYTAYLQGGTNFHASRISIMLAAQAMQSKSDEK